MNRKKLLHTEIFKEKEQVCNKLNINCEKIKLGVSSTKGLTGSAAIFFGNEFVHLNKNLLKWWKSDKDVVRTVLAHELVHIKYKDPSFRNGIVTRLKTLFSKKAQALVLLMEMRADVEGIATLKLSSTEIERIQMILREFNYSPSKKDSYKLGYPDRYQITEFASKYKVFDDVAKEELLTDFCKVRNINNSRFIEQVIKEFNHNYYQVS
ncbi:M48 family metalloprotease [Viridibacillus arvi]|uniref:M48 family metalloprotease n=1 Tax=Viridibacillus arvi TaxID=263475 RepID=UPI0034CFA2A9